MARPWCRALWAARRRHRTPWVHRLGLGPRVVLRLRLAAVVIAGCRAPAVLLALRRLRRLRLLRLLVAVIAGRCAPTVRLRRLCLRLLSLRRLLRRLRVPLRLRWRRSLRGSLSLACARIPTLVVVVMLVRERAAGSQPGHDDK